ncbi:MAG: HlyD family type I secretion periplasmic adaptor subunit, partial [Caulobacterales bacterium]|nr:HlyD family type I secretion periplasmic adaptor subunit [Caulobacterales bacterium]
EKTNQDYFLARVDFDNSAVQSLSGLEVHPGMHASVLVLTGQRTALSYLVDPIANALRHAMREA